MTHRTQDIGFEHSKISRLLSEESGNILLPDFLLNLSSESMRTLSGGFFEPREVTTVEAELEDAVEEEPHLNLTNTTIIDEPAPIAKVIGNCTVAAVDVSSVRVGESEQGFLYALRGALVWHEAHRFSQQA
ncbi:hypothetical protein MUP59_11035 [Candidatus Bathyarchaeota archaeon]|nr:hypothetical protein [Candidatus Bathyarchaeota archaeon]